MQSNELLLLDKIAKITAFKVKCYNHPDKKVCSVLQDVMEILLRRLCSLYLEHGLPAENLAYIPDVDRPNALFPYRNAEKSSSYRAFIAEQSIGANFFGKPWSTTLTPSECDRIFYTALGELKTLNFLKINDGLRHTFLITVF